MPNLEDLLKPSEKEKFLESLGVNELVEIGFSREIAEKASEGAFNRFEEIRKYVVGAAHDGKADINSPAGLELCLFVAATWDFFGDVMPLVQMLYLILQRMASAEQKTPKHKV